MLDINQVSIVLMRDYEKEFFDLPKNMYSDYAPVIELNTHRYKSILLEKKDPICYIKHKNKDLWVYEDKNKGGFIFKPLQKDTVSFGKYIPPTVFYLEYIGEPIFFLYIPIAMGYTQPRYISYNDDSVLFSYTTSASNATKFIFTEIDLDWSNYITQNLYAKNYYNR
jgi:hypothetical protein